MIDLISLTLQAGNGGNGKVSFFREKYITKGGPDGGHGGDGGSVILVGTRRFNTLKHYAGKKGIRAESGAKGGRKKKTGANGADALMEVPLGTVVWLTAENQASTFRRQKYGIEHILSRREVNFQEYRVGIATANPEPRVEDTPQSLFARAKLIEITQEGQRVVLAQGGFGGRGNIAFKSSTNITPLEAQYGTFGEQKFVTLELKLLADIGLVGLPNAGKSMLLSKLTHAHPKIANYPFTTIEPNLGVLSVPGGGDLVVADVPGLIAGASQGKGLGLDFLRHIENCQVLIFVLFLEESVVSDESLTDQQKADTVWNQYQQLRDELHAYQAEMLKKPSVVALNKIDVYSPELIGAIEQRFEKEQQTILPFSGFTGKGLPELIESVTHRSQV